MIIHINHIIIIIISPPEPGGVLEQHKQAEPQRCRALICAEARAHLCILYLYLHLHIHNITYVHIFVARLKHISCQNYHKKKHLCTDL